MTSSSTVHNYLIKEREDNTYTIYCDKDPIATKGSPESACKLLLEIMIKDRSEKAESSLYPELSKLWDTWIAENIEKK